MATKGLGVFCTKLVSAFKLEVSAETVRLFLVNHGYSYAGMKVSPLLTPSHKKKRLEFCRQHLTSKHSTNFSHWIFSDEKWFNLDGPDGVYHYWRLPDDLLKSNRSFEGVSVMFWEAIVDDKKVALVEVENSMNSLGYQRILEDNFLPFYRNSAEPLVFQQDNALPHVSRSTLDWLKAENIEVLNWPSLSIDFSPIEKIWSCLVHKLYSPQKSYSKRNDLRAAVFKAWNELTSDDIRKLPGSSRQFRLVEPSQNTKLNSYSVNIC